MRWLVADSLYCPEAFFASHLDSYSHYLREYGETVDSYCLNINVPQTNLHEGDAMREADIVFVLDRYHRVWPTGAKRIAQVAAICDPMPWDVRKSDGSPAYDLVISSIPWMCDEARAKGCRAEYMGLAFDTRALVCGMGVTERDIPCLFIGSQGGNHKRRTQLLSELSDVITIAPPTFGRDYFRMLARARSVFHCGAEWARGAMNAMRVTETMGMGALLIADQDPTGGPFMHGVHCAKYRDTKDVRAILEMAAPSPDRLSRSVVAATGQGEVLKHHTYESRIPDLVRWASEL